MSAPPSCPADYSCTFTLLKPHVISHAVGPWWKGAGGLAVVIIVAIVVACLLAYLIFLWHEGRDEKHARVERELERKQALALEEQRTYQLDTAKGDPEAIKLIREMQRGSR